MSLRSKYSDLIFGRVEQFGSNQLPTEADVIKEVLFHVRDKEYTTQSNRQIFKQTAQHVKEIWTKTGIQILADYSIQRKVQKIYDGYYAVFAAKHRPEIFEQSGKSLRARTEKTLFDISSCKCETECHCPYNLKVSLRERDFLFDQRNCRKMFIGSIDLNATRRANINSRRKQQDNGSSPMKKKKKETTETVSLVSSRAVTPALPSVTTKYKKLNNVAREIQRCGVSLSNAATLFNALFKDLNLANENNLVDRNQMQRNVARFNAYVVGEHLQNVRNAINDADCCALYFDDKKDNTKTMIINDETSKLHPRTQSEEHYTMIFQPHNLYYAHITPTSSKAEPIAESIIRKLEDDQIDLNKIKFLGCDGTNVNTGEFGGKFIASPKFHWL